MTAPFFPAGAAEFPNDNPGLHDGARWVCPEPVGPVRALVRPRASGGAIPVVAAELEQAPRLESEPVPELRFEGPLQLDLGRIVLLHRVEDIPPPPAFIFRPFTSSRSTGEHGTPTAGREAPLAVTAPLEVTPSGAAPVEAPLAGEAALVESLLGDAGFPEAVEALADPEMQPEPEPVAVVELADAVLAAIAPRQCRVVDEHQARRRVARGWRVDVAPCVSVDASASPSASLASSANVGASDGPRVRVRQRRISTARVLPPSALVLSLEQLVEAAIA